MHREKRWFFIAGTEEKEGTVAAFLDDLLFQKAADCPKTCIIAIIEERLAAIGLLVQAWPLPTGSKYCFV
ncbi:hypothetical protein SAMN05421736_102329 [Evansella caseinilytica]|uniref:Uncharacterized protein n=1 Tax=Evansella caseinilytica TaxID=1503961 RepID=A0A1H3L1M5_9BACI|nr:hypothetical protein SAMN05421736_102329 [Evansella caseinilytica]